VTGPLVEPPEAEEPRVRLPTPAGERLHHPGFSLDAATAEETEGRSPAVIDLRSLSPLDLPTLAASVHRTGRAVVLDQAPRFLGMGAETAAELTGQCFFFLEAPVQRVAGYDVPSPPGRVEEDFLRDPTGCSMPSIAPSSTDCIRSRERRAQ
jgi:hypothetical protein